MKGEFRTFVLYPALIGLLVLPIGPSRIWAGAPETANAAAEKERKLLRVLQSGASPGEKAVTCKQLAIYGTEKAVPALAALLADEHLASWARIALEAIPGPAADKALREASGKLRGKLLVGVLNSIGVRRDAEAVSLLLRRLRDADAEVASAAAVALGRTGGTKASVALKKSLVVAPAEARPALAEGCMLCAEGFFAQGKPTEAVELYDAVRSANVPRQKVLEATRGAILARQSAGLPLLLEQLRSADKGRFGIGLRTARELPGHEVTEALVAEVHQCNPERQPLVLLALAERNDPAALPAVLEAAGTGSPKLRLVAIGLLERLGDVSCLPVLLQAATGSKAEVAAAAMGVLSRLPGREVDADLFARLGQASGKQRQVLIELAVQRRIEGALAAIVPSAEDADAGVRAAAVQAIGALGEEKEAAGLVKLLSKAQSASERANMEAALSAISGRAGRGCVPHLLPLAQSEDRGLRIAGLHALAGAGGPEALGVVKAALADPDEGVQDEAVRTLSTWPNTWPEDAEVLEPLLELAKSGKKASHQVLGLRGYLQYVQGDKKLPGGEKVEKVRNLVPLLQRPEEKRQAIAVINAIPTAGALDLLTAFAADPAVAEEACSALLKLADQNLEGAARAQRQKALQTVVEKSKDERRKKKAREMLIRL